MFLVPFAPFVVILLVYVGVVWKQSRDPFPEHCAECGRYVDGPGGWRCESKHLDASQAAC